MIDTSNDTSLDSGGAGAGRVPADTDSVMDLALPLETEAPSSSSPLIPTSSEAPPAASVAAAAFEPTLQPTQQPYNTVAVALVATILIALVLLTVAYVLYQKRRRLCGGGQRQADKGRDSKPDLSANEALITPVKANGGVESVPDGGSGGGNGAGLVSGPREKKSRQAVPRKWYDSAAMKYMDQSTDTLDRV